MNTQSFDAKLCSDLSEMYKIGIGAFCFSPNDKRILMLIPDKNGEPQMSSINIKDKTLDPYWKWDGNREKPTLSPSLHMISDWHGFLKDGRFESC